MAETKFLAILDEVNEITVTFGGPHIEVQVTLSKRVWIEAGRPIEVEFSVGSDG